ncbi:hypothetical protein DN730_10505 [Marinomonas piezotolerans]|uniref:3-deoxy-manno-octulosonate cytidylyltransferase n=1 Tax=Marinomonas piezotolerans TaxID=2213058 RepID=A0A370U8E2_9GAMM|nr:3-deoxy-manno-octulosonate cytidylyltransferase [Marinomonas piezotolerans]RDL44059.1 hypothetical protein DN730_10505 [Marinomonas piezotolerans]
MENSRVVGLIPSRLQSSRLPNKPILKIGTYEMVVHVGKRSSLSKRLDEIFVCTDSREITNICSVNNIPVILTSNDHSNGTERIGEAAKNLGLSDDDIVVDIQGDEALVDPMVIDRVVNHLHVTGADIVVPYIEITDGSNENRVKLVESSGRVLYMTRAAAPYQFFGLGSYKKHLSVIAFKYSALKVFCSSPASPLEKIEGVELLRAIENGLRVVTYREESESIAVDTMDDYKQVCKLILRDQYYGKY